MKMSQQKLDNLEKMCAMYLVSKYRREQEYGNYLDKWLHGKDIRCDGLEWEDRMRSSEPMPFNIYFS